MLNPIVHLYVAVAARSASVPPATPRVERPVPGRPSPDPLRPYHGFHFHRHGYGGYGPEGTDSSTTLLIVLGVGAVVLALAAWLFLVWRQRRRPAAATGQASMPGVPQDLAGTGMPGAPGFPTGRPRFPGRGRP